jgi:hypothetical protein
MTFNVMAQSNSSPIIGYDRLTWGSTVQQFMQAYPSASEINSDNAFIGIREFKQKNVGNGIVERTFYFFQNKLYRVWVDYGEQDNSAFDAILAKIVSIYGKFDDNDETSKVSGYSSIKMYDLIRYYNGSLTVTVRGADIYNQYNYLVSSMVSCNYTNPVVESEIARALSKSKSEQFGL